MFWALGGTRVGGGFIAHYVKSFDNENCVAGSTLVNVFSSSLSLNLHPTFT